MEISQYIKDEARALLQKGQALPTQIPAAPAFYLAEAMDDSVTAFAALQYGGKEFKIGIAKEGT